MFKGFQRALQFRAAVVFGLIHLGLVASLVSLVQVARSGVETSVLYWMIGSIVGLYGGVLAGVFFVVWPALPWIRRARRVMQWREVLLSDLPKLIALVPVILQLVRAVRGAWNSFNEKESAAPKADSMRDLTNAIVDAVQAAQSATQNSTPRSAGRTTPHEVA